MAAKKVNRIAIAYIHVSNSEKSEEHALRFVTSFKQFPPLYPADIFVICNGGPISYEMMAVFSPLSARTIFRKNDNGWDISAYIECSKGPLYNYDTLLCLGESCHFHRAGWLKRIVDAREKWGHGMYSPFATHVIRAHLQTTAFATCPRMLIEYPLPMKTREDRFQFEHGERAYWRQVHKRGYAVKLVTWSGEFSPGQWRLPKNGLWAGDQSDLLWHANHSENWAKLPAQRKLNWQRSADRTFK